MHYNGPEPCWCGCQSEHVFVLEGLERPLPREPLYFQCPSSGDALGFTSRGEWRCDPPAAGVVPVKVSRQRFPGQA